VILSSGEIDFVVVDLVGFSLKVGILATQNIPYFSTLTFPPQELSYLQNPVVSEVLGVGINPCVFLIHRG